MKIAVLVARILLGLLFLFFGLNGFLNFLHAPMPPGPAGQYMALLGRTFYMHFVFLVQIVGGASAAFRPVHPAGADSARPGDLQHPPLSHNHAACGFAARHCSPLVLWLIIFYGVRQAFAGIFAHKVASPENLSFGFWDWPRYTAHRSAG